MSDFQSRLANDQKLKEIFAEFFETFLEGTAAIRFLGVEQKLSAKDHEQIRYKSDPTTRFVRYAPDAFVFWNAKLPRTSLLVEFKTASVGLKFDKAPQLVEMREKVEDLRKDEVMNMELDSYGNMCLLRGAGLDVIVWAYCAFHPSSRWLAIVPDTDLNLRPYAHDEMARTTGSGTSIANVFVRIDNSRVFALDEWLAQRFDLDRQEVKAWLDERDW